MNYREVRIDLGLEGRKNRISTTQMHQERGSSTGKNLQQN